MHTLYIYIYIFIDVYVQTYKRSLMGRPSQSSESHFSSRSQNRSVLSDPNIPPKLGGDKEQVKEPVLPI